jgi:acyl-CoA thioesterase
VNADLTVTLLRRPAGEWFALDARTLAAGEGAGLADTRYWDERGVLGRGVQALVVEPRPE